MRSHWTAALDCLSILNQQMHCACPGFETLNAHQTYLAGMISNEVGLSLVRTSCRDACGCCISRYYPLTDEQVAAWPMPTAREFANMFSYYRHFPYYDELRSLDKRAAAGPSFKEWAQAHKEQLQKKLEAA